jgi:hypothetical protein
MHRHRIRAFIAGAGGGETDVPVTIFAAGQYVRYISGVGLQTTSLGPGTTTVDAITTWGDTTGTQLLQTPVLLDNAGNMTQLVTLDGQDAPRITATLATATPTTGKLTKWASSAAPWKLDATQTLEVVNIDGIDTLYGVGGINGRDPAKWVQGPASATDNEVPRYDGVTGKLIQGSGVALSDTGQLTGLTEINGRDPSKWVNGPTPAASTDTAIARWDGASGRLIKESTVYLDNAGSITNVLNMTSLNGSLSGFQFISGVVNLTFAGTSNNIVNLTLLNGRDPNKWVEGPNVSVINRIATFSTTNGKNIQDSGAVTVSGSSVQGVGALNSIGVGSSIFTGVTGINGRDPSRWVQGSTTSVNVGRITTWASGAATSIQETPITVFSDGSTSGFTSLNNITVGLTSLGSVGSINGTAPSSWVVGPASATANRVPTFADASGKLLTQSPVTIDNAGNVAGVNALNGVFPYEWMKGTLTFFGGSTGISPGYGLPKRASSYRVGFVAFVPVSFGDTTGTISLSMSSDDNNGTWQVHMPNASAAVSLGSGGTWPNPGTFVNASFIFAATCVVPAGSGTYGLNLSISSTGSMTMLTGWQFWTYQ